MDDRTIMSQLKRNAVALISLVIAITSLVYNTWRNEHTEYNRNQRNASFAILAKLGELQELIFLNHYDCNFSIRGNVRTGWAMVQTIQDHTMVLKDFPADTADGLKASWSDNWNLLEYDSQAACENRSEARASRGEQATQDIRKAIDAHRENILDVLRSLE